MTALVTVLCLVGYLLGYFVYARWWHDGVAVLFVVGSMLLVPPYGWWSRRRWRTRASGWHGRASRPGDAVARDA